MKKYRHLILPAVIFTLAVAARLIPGLRTIDDAYITFRYARNILSGYGFVFNPGERVMGTTTGLYTLLMTGLGALAGGPQANFPLIAALVNALADGLTCLLIFAIGKRIHARFAGIAAALAWAVAPFSVTFAIGGLETSLYVFLLTASAYAYLEDRQSWAALLAGLSFLTRPDAVILILPLGLDWLYCILHHKKSWPYLRTIAAFLVPVLAWSGFATLYFGSPIPNSIQAKLNAYHLAPTEAFVRLAQHFATPFLTQNWIGTPAAVAIGLVLFPALFIIGARYMLRRLPRLWPWLIYPWLYLVIFSISNPLIFRWYLTPPLPFYFLGILVGLEQVLSGLLHPKTLQIGLPWRQTIGLALLLVLPVGGSLSDWRIHPDHGPDRPAPQMAYIGLELLYRQVADQISPRLTSNTILAAGDVGVLGYYTQARILDLVGLNSPVSTDYYPLDDSYYVINYAIPPDLILEQKPDVLVLLEVYGRNGLLQNTQFNHLYEVGEVIPTDIYSSKGMMVFWKK